MAKFKLEDGTEVEAFTAEEMQAQIDEQVTGLKSKVDELLGETKAEREKRKELEKAQSEAEKKSAEEKGEFKKLYETETKAKSELQKKLDDFQQKIADRDQTAAAMQVAGQLTKDSKRAEVLTDYAKRFTRYEGDQVVYEIGGVPVDAAKVTEHLKAEYPFLVDGSQANGGGAAGSGSGASGSKQINRSTFDGMSQAERATFAKEGGKVVDD